MELHRYARAYIASVCVNRGTVVWIQYSMRKHDPDIVSLKPCAGQNHTTKPRSNFTEVSSVRRNVGETIEKCGGRNLALALHRWQIVENRFGNCAGKQRLRLILFRVRRNYYVRAEGSEFGIDAAFGVGLEIEEGCGDGGSCGKSEQDDKEASTVGKQEAAH